MQLTRMALTAAVLAMPGSVLAHAGGGTAAGFIPGLAHPVGGLDHLLAALAMGLWAAQSGGRSVWTVPLTFVGALVLGGVLGASDVGLPGVEPGIAGSVLVLGLLVAGAARLPVGAGMSLAGLFALLHGHAHGAEMAAGAPLLPYGAGLLLSTAGLHAVGLLAGRAGNARVVRVFGAGVAVAGALLLGGLA